MASFGHWRADWRAEEAEKLLAKQKLALAGQRKKEGSLAEQLAALKVELEEARALLEAKEVEKAEAARGVEAAYQKQLEEQAEAEKEKRVAMLQQQAQRRMANRDLFAGWSVCHEQWAEAARQKRMLAAAGARLQRPQLVAAVSAWKVDWQAAQAEKEAKRREEMVAAHAAAAAAHGDELTRLRAEHAAALEALRSSHPSIFEAYHVVLVPRDDVEGAAGAASETQRHEDARTTTAS